MYVLENNNTVLNGPRAWNYRSFESTLDEDLEISYKLPMSKTDDEIITIDDNTHIYPAELIQQNYNPKIEYLHGPFWDFSTGKAIGTFEIVQHSIESIQNTLKAKVADNRWIKENKGITVTVQDTEISIDTSRGNRDIFIQKYLLLSDNDTLQWKFAQAWLVLSKQDLGVIVNAINRYIQAQFDWEAEKIAEISSALTHEELDLIDLGNPVVGIWQP